jgi:hypothetical protein
MPVLEMTFSDVAGDPWEGRATVRFQGDPSQPFPVREGMTSKQRGELRWYVEQYMDLPEGGNATRAAAVVQELAAYGHALWNGLQSDVVSQWLGAVQAAGEGRLELRAQAPRDEGAFRTPWELIRVGEALEGVDFHQRKDPRAWIENQLARRRMLIVWDNYESVLPAFNAGRPAPPEFAQLAPSWTAGGSRLLITCRDAEVGFDARPFPLDELSTPEGLMVLVGFLEEALLIDRARREFKGWTAADLELIVRRAGGHPLALELLASQIPALGPRRVLDELSTLLARIEQESPEDRNRSMWASLDFSIRHLSEETRAAFSSVALLSGGCPEKMADDEVGLEGDAWGRVRTELERTGLVRLQDGFFRPHPILGDFVGRRSPAARTPTARVAGVERSEPLGTRSTGGSLRSTPATPRTGQDASPALDVTPEADERFIAVVRSFAAEFDQLVRRPGRRRLRQPGRIAGRPRTGRPLAGRPPQSPRHRRPPARRRRPTSIHRPRPTSLGGRRVARDDIVGPFLPSGSQAPAWEPGEIALILRGLRGSVVNLAL